MHKNVPFKLLPPGLQSVSYPKVCKIDRFTTNILLYECTVCLLVLCMVLISSIFDTVLISAFVSCHNRIKLTERKKKVLETAN